MNLLRALNFIVYKFTLKLMVILPELLVDTFNLF